MEMHKSTRRDETTSHVRRVRQWKTIKTRLANMEQVDLMVLQSRKLNFEKEKQSE